MSDTEMLWSALLFELGTSIAIIAGLAGLPHYRRLLIVPAGALTPAMALYGLVSLMYLLNPTDKSNIFAFYAMWAMTFLAYVATLAGGFVLAFLPKPNKLYLRYLVGLASAPLSYFLLTTFFYFF